MTTDVHTDIDLEPPADTISEVHFNPQSSSELLASSWDSQVRLYDVASNTVKSSITHRAAVLSCGFDANPKFAYSGGLDTWVRRLDLETEDVRVLGAHEAPVSSVIYDSETNQLFTGSWDQTVAVWDPRRGNPNSRINSVPQVERVYHLGIVKNSLVVATAGRKVANYDVRNLSKPTELRTTSLKFSTTALACMPEGEGYAVGSVEGRVGIEYFDTSPAVQAGKYAFKCHRETVPENDLVFDVQALAFHPVFGTLATGGSDGTVAVWDHRAKKRLRLYSRFPTAVSALAFSADGSKLAIGVSTSHEDNNKNAISDDPIVKKKLEMLQERKEDVNFVGLIVRNVGEELKRKTQR